MKRFLAIFPMLALVAVSCSQLEEKEPATPSSKDSAIQLTVSSDSFCGPFAKGHEISVLDNTGNHKFTADAEGTTASFSGQAYTRALERIVLSPYAAGASFDADSIMVNVPAEQNAFSPIAVGVSSTKKVSLRPVTSALGINLSSSDVVSVKIEGAAGEAFTGDAKIAVNAK